MRKIKLEDRISLSYILLFLALMLVSNVILVSLLIRQNNRTLEQMAEQKMKEIDSYFNKVEIFTSKFSQFTFIFEKKVVDGQVTHAKPFNYGTERYLYVVKAEVEKDTSNNSSKMETQYPINTVNAVDEDKNNIEAKKLMKYFEKINLKENDPKGKKITLEDGETYHIFKVKREIKNNEFNVYVLRNITEETKIYKRLEILATLITVTGVIVTLIISRVLSRNILVPIKNIINTAKDITTDDLSKRIEVQKSGDELEKLTLIINQMLDRLESSFENQSKFVSDASHELRTPLTIVNGYAQLLQRRKETNPEILEEAVEAIINETKNMKNLVEKLLFLAKGEMNKINASFREIQMDELIEQIKADVEISMKSHNFILEKTEKFVVKAEKTLIQQAIRALIENAIKYSDEGTNVYLKAEIVEDMGVISVRDEGVGITEEDKKRIFDRFYRVDKSRTKSTGGSGLGLAIVKKIVEIHDGVIDIDSKFGEGTEILIKLPLFK